MSRRRVHEIPGVALVASVLVLAVVVNAIVLASQPATVTPRAITPLPVTLTAVALTGTTVTGGTSASTTTLTPSVLGTATLTMAREAPDDWDVRVAITSTSGITGGETLEIRLVGASTVSVTAAAGSSLPLVSSPVTLGAAGLTVVTATTSAISGCHSCNVQAELRITPAGVSLPLFVYPYSVTTAV